MTAAVTALPATLPGNAAGYGECWILCGEGRSVIGRASTPRRWRGLAADPSKGAK